MVAIEETLGGHADEMTSSAVNKKILDLILTVVDQSLFAEVPFGSSSLSTVQLSVLKTNKSLFVIKNVSSDDS